ncbi:MAG: nucleoside transporter C-terminal domain-containing protein [Rickettsiales bacterium]
MLNNLFHLGLSLLVFYSIAFLMSGEKRSIKKLNIVRGFLLQFFLAFLILKIPAITQFFIFIGQMLASVSESTLKATSFMFGKLGDHKSNGNIGFILAIHGMPILIVIGAISALLMRWKILPILIKGFSCMFRKALRIGGTIGLGVSANIFTGMSETPLIVKSYLKHLTKSELFSLMVCGAAGVSSSVMMLYSIILDPVIPHSLSHIISAALISVPGAITISRIIVPEKHFDKITEAGDVETRKYDSTLDALYSGIIDGGKVMIKVILMLIAFVALIDVINSIFAYFTPSQMAPVTIQTLLGYLMSPVAWIVGIPWNEAVKVGSLLGTKFVLNEIIAFTELVKVAPDLTIKSRMVSLYALSSFANIGSIGVMIGVYTALVEKRKLEILEFGMKAVIAGSLVNYINAAIINVLM